jgi:hypothetical protein
LPKHWAISNDVCPCSAAICPGRHRRGIEPQAARNASRSAIFDGEKEAKLIALACSKPLEGHAKWTLRLLERKVVELNIVDHASDNTIGRVLKKQAQASSQTAMGHPAASKQRICSGDGGYSGRLQAAA